MHTSFFKPLLCFLALVPSLVLAEAEKADAKKSATEKPTLSRIEPRGIQRGLETKVRLVGDHFHGLSGLKFSNGKLKGEIVAAEKANEAWIKVLAPDDFPRGSHDLSVTNEKGESAKVKVFIDDLPQFDESKTSKEDAPFVLPTPASFWGTLNPPGDSDLIEFTADAGKTFVFDLEAKGIGSKANIRMTLLDATGKPLASNNGYEGGDPLLSFHFPKYGKYRIKIEDQMMGGSAEHFYKLTVGEYSFVTAIHPLSVRTNSNAEVTLVGFNLGDPALTSFKAEKLGDMNVPIDAEKFRFRKAMKVLVTDQNELVESEPNDSPATAMTIPIPAVVSGRLWKPETTDHDFFRFEANAGVPLVFETDAARRGSPIDTKIEILHPDGKPVERLLLQAVRDSQINFRSIDSNTGDIRVENWEEMELNEFMYLKGEVCKIFRMPEGPDSGFQFYRNGGKRITYFDTSATAHALDEQAYIVEPHPPGTRLAANGLPVFTLHYANDDDGERELGSDSRLLFTAPTNGPYVIRVTDTRSFSGERFAYRLIAREARQDFSVRLNNTNPTLPPGSGQTFSVRVDRMDGFDDEIKVEISNVPEGFFISTPLVIEAGHLQANGTIFAASDAKEPDAEAMSKIKVTATATVEGKQVVKEINSFGKIKLGEKPKLIVAIEPYNESDTAFNERSVTDQPLEITVVPGEVVPAWLKIKREGHDDLVTFGVENLPHGVIVDNIGLNGVLIPKEENERQIFLRCAKWVPETDRLAYCQARQAGNPTSLPVLIKVRRDGSTTASK